ncbi:MAG: hypothetical protein JWN89_511 [Parcubacteria group bacterium]|nr:hypothetical protein [Parcubacteria group bacterium]
MSFLREERMRPLAASYVFFALAIFGLAEWLYLDFCLWCVERRGGSRRAFIRYNPDELHKKLRELTETIPNISSYRRFHAARLGLRVVSQVS